MVPCTDRQMYEEITCGNIIVYSERDVKRARTIAEFLQQKNPHAFMHRNMFKSK